MLGLLDLRERGERLEPSRFESDPTVTDTVRGILQRVRERVTLSSSSWRNGSTAPTSFR